MDVPDTNEIMTKFSSLYYDLYRDEIQRRNSELLKWFSFFGLGVAGAGVLTRALLRGGNLLPPFVVLFVLFVLLIVLRKRIVRLFGGNNTLALYVVEAPTWVIGIMLGSVLDPNNRAITFFMFVALLPLFILDRPKRVLSYTFFWLACFSVASWAVKPMDLFLKDMSFTVMYAVASMVTTGLLLIERLDSVKLFVESEEHARTSETTGLKNHYAFECDMRAYLNTPIIIGVSRIDDLQFFVDSFGHSIESSILSLWGASMTDHFGTAHSYSHSTRELLVMLPHMNPRKFEKLAGGFLLDFERRVGAELHIRPACSIGYVFGTPATEEELKQMINHADVLLSEAQRAGRSQIRGAEFDPNHSQHEELDALLGGNLQSDSIDAITGLPNMHAFRMRARSLVDTYVTDSQNLPYIIYYDIENFKEYNEDYGFQKGDDLLRSIAQIICDSFPRRLVARFGDDHFVVMCYRTELESGLAQTLNLAFDLHGRTSMPLKAGVYALRDRNENIGLACDCARAACNSIKSRYDVFWREYDEELRAVEERRRHIIGHVDDAVDQGWLRVYYQPIVYATTGEVVECEALVRWIDPVYGFMPPDAFISELEKAHLIHKIDLWVARRVCADYHDRVVAGLTPLPVSINLSRLDFILCDIDEEINKLTEQYEVPSSDLHIEVTESALSEDFTQLLNVTSKLRAQGYEIWLDDFGSDYSSLTTLKDFPCDVIKLDLMFLRASDGNKRARLIIKQIIEMANALGARSLVEGVEEQHHLDFLASIGCDYCQGYLISKPEPIETLVEQGLIPS